MKNSIIIFFVTTLLSPISRASLNGKVFEVATKKEITRTDFLSNLSLSSIIVIGEKHYTKEVQALEGKIISDVVTFTGKENNFSLFWEFLNASSQEQTQTLFNQVITHELSTADFLIKTQGSNKAIVYSPIIEATINFGGKLFGGNLSREEKAPVITGGLAALDPKHLPPNFELGGRNYLERFTEVMSGHATPEQIANYFVAQSLVDDAIAYHMHKDSNSDLKFLVIGSFHSMYNDGVVERLKVRNHFSKISNIEIVDSSDYTIQEIENIFTDEKYGEKADFIIFVNEPMIRRNEKVFFAGPSTYFCAKCQK